MITIAVGNQKGGVGKTTTAVALGQYFSRRGKRVLIVDLDAQGHVAESLGVDKSGGLFRLICQGLAVEQVVRADDDGDQRERGAPGGGAGRCKIFAAADPT